ncbi:cysteine desulfurase family protein, partial [Trichothermofontia sp.]
MRSTLPLQIYLDYSATTPPRPEAIAAMQAALRDQWGNPSSLHVWGQRAATVLEQARIQVAGLLNAAPEAIVFTAGGTEADNLAIWGIAQHYPTPRHLIISQVEHSAIREPVRLLEERGWEVTRLPVNSEGWVNPLNLQLALRRETVLVSIIYGQSEVGTLQSIAELGRICRDRGVLFHTDAVQVAGRLAIDVQTLPVDLLSLSSHKLYGPQGVGALYVRPGLELVPLLAGGGQEGQRRSGTQAVAAIAGFGVAAELAAQEMATETPRLMALRDRLFAQLADTPHLIPTGVQGKALQAEEWRRLPHHVSFCVDLEQPLATDRERITGKTIVHQMNLAGIGISSGAACNSGKTLPSPTLLA